MGYELGSTQDLITGFDQEAAAVVMAHKVLFKMVSIVKPSFKVSLPKEVEVVELPKSVKPDAHFVMKLLMGNSNYRQWLPKLVNCDINYVGHPWPFYFMGCSCSSKGAV